MEKLYSLADKIFTFFKKYGILIAPVFLFLFFMFLLVLSYTSKPQSVPVLSNPTPLPNNTNSNPSRTTENKNQSTSISTSPSPPSDGMNPDNDEPNLPVWSGSSFSPSDFGNININQTTLPDGSTQYSYNSDTPNRPNIIIVKNNINVFQQTPMYNITASINSSPEYIAKGSNFWGKNDDTYIYLSKGVADVIDVNNKQIVEEIIFQPGNLEQFEQYDTDMIGQPQTP